MPEALVMYRGIISIHAPPRGATCLHLPYTMDYRFQFTPLREGRRRRSRWKSSGRQFQFTPLREGRRDQRRLAVPEKHFNSRPSARGDHQPTSRPAPSAISIHAPPRGATRCPAPRKRTARFQFTPLREGRRIFKLYPRKEAYFNSRPSARGDLRSIRADRKSCNVNSRPSARGDGIDWQLRLLDSIISFHAPPRGAT